VTNLSHRVVFSSLRVIGRTICRVDDREIAKIPMHGPLIIVANHVNFLDVPLLYTHLQPRAVTGFAKMETWNNPALGALFSIGQAIPIRRGEVDRSAVRQALDALRQGQILALAPEGTRSGTGRLQKGRTGVAMLALESGAPVIPVAYFGGERFQRNIVRLRRTNFRIVVGESFCVRKPEGAITRLVREQITREIMYRLANILPPKYQGYYAQPNTQPDQYLIACEPE
jgi:1-acyl-sn-glycerol-3-phosphate acyltransferase